MLSGDDLGVHVESDGGTGVLDSMDEEGFWGDV